MKSLILAAAVSFALAGPTLAGSCPKLMGEVDAALASNPSISAEQMTEVTELRAQGEAQHGAGQHAESVESLNKAKEILGIM